MDQYRQYGTRLPQIVLVHGGPGAPGELRPLARILEKKGFSSLEALQSGTTIAEQVEELKVQVEESGLRSVTLLGYSWGAWLAILLAEKYPDLVDKLILVSTPPFTKEEAIEISKRRLDKLSSEQQKVVSELVSQIESENYEERVEAFRALALLFRGTDAYSLLTEREYVLEYQVDVFRSVWKEAEEKRASGEMLERFSRVRQPLIFIHGDDDPHSSTAIIGLLKNMDLDAVYYEIPNCGHSPWLERFGQFRFISIVENELRIG